VIHGPLHSSVSGDQVRFKFPDLDTSTPQGSEVPIQFLSICEKECVGESRRKRRESSRREEASVVDLPVSR
jgi:hypothetical protein